MEVTCVVEENRVELEIYNYVENYILRGW